jgi:hypothetical protein
MVYLPKKATCSQNQLALDRLHKELSNQKDGSILHFAIKRAIPSVVCCTKPILTASEALELKYVGDAVVKYIFPPSLLKTTDTSVAKKIIRLDESTSTPKIKKQRLLKETNASAVHLDQTPTESNEIATAQTTGSKTSEGSSYMHDNHGNIIGHTKLNDFSRLTTVSKSATIERRSTILAVTNANAHHKATSKQISYSRALKVAKQKLYLNQGYQWRVVLIIDSREREANYVQKVLQAKSIACEIRTLPTGDIA